MYKYKQKGGQENNSSQLITIPDVFLNLINKTNKFSDLVRLCNMSSVTRTYCSKYSKEYFLDLILKNKSFRDDYYLKLLELIDKNDNEKFKFMLNYYPVGKFYGNNLKIINDLHKFAKEIGTSLSTFLEFDKENKYSEFRKFALQGWWSSLLKFIFLLPDYLTEKTSSELQQLSNLSFFELGWGKSKYNLGFWNIQTFFDITDIFKFITAGEESPDTQTNLQDPEASLARAKKMFIPILESSKLINVSYSELENAISDFIIFHLKSVQRSDDDLFKAIITILIKQILYFVYTTDDDDMIDFADLYDKFTMNLFYKLHELDPKFVNPLIVETFKQMDGLDLQNYQYLQENPNYPHLERIFRDFAFNSPQSGGANRIKTKTRSKCKSEKIGQVMHEFKYKQLKTQWGQKVTNPKQAIAIGLSMAKKYCK